jgi:hypothetical protein
MPRLISLYSNTMQSGKSEVAKVLCDKHGFQSVSFAGPLKAMTKTLLDRMGFDRLTVAEMMGGSLKETPIAGLGVTPRFLMQTLGTEWGRDAVKQSLWVDVALATVKSYWKQGYSVVIDDMRFPNEMKAVKDFGGTTAIIIRPDAAPYSGHPSEGLLSDFSFDHIIHNDGTLYSLWQRASGLVS